MIQRVGLHILFWSAILYWRTNGDFLTKFPFELFLKRNLLRLPAIMLATYSVIYLLLPKYIVEKKDYLSFGFFLSLIIFIATQADQLLMDSDFMKWFLNLESYWEAKYMTQLHPFRESFLLLSIIGIASLIRFYKLFLEKEQKENELIQEKLETQYTFLKAQVNPHFLYNALNNIYSMAIQREQADIASGIENLSDIMKYLTYESNAKQVPLEKEVKLLQNYIDIEQLRLDDTDDTTISFNLESSLENHQIVPVILLPLVENAFKHGVKPDQKCLVSIKLNVVNKQLNFSIKNTFFDFENREIKEKGIGLENVRKRLELRYPKLHSLETFQQEGYFFTQLTIKLEEHSQPSPDFQNLMS